MRKFFITIVGIFFCALTSVPVFSQVEIQELYGATRKVGDTLFVDIDAADNSGAPPEYGTKLLWLSVLNKSANTVQYNLEFDWLCSNSSVYYQLCEQLGGGYQSCHTFHKEGSRVYGTIRSLAPDTVNSLNYFDYHVKIHDYSTEVEHEKIGKVSAIDPLSNATLAAVYLVVRRGNLPCNLPQPAPTAIGDVWKGSDLNIFPNPANNYVVIDDVNNELQSYSLHDIYGKKLRVGKIQDLANNKLDLAEVSPGVYFLTLVNKSEQAIVRKIVVNH